MSGVIYFDFFLKILQYRTDTFEKFLLWVMTLQVKIKLFPVLSGQRCPPWILLPCRGKWCACNISRILLLRIFLPIILTNGYAFLRLIGAFPPPPNFMYVLVSQTLCLVHTYPLLNMGIQITPWPFC